MNYNSPKLREAHQFQMIMCQTRRVAGVIDCIDASFFLSFVVVSAVAARPRCFRKLSRRGRHDIQGRKISSFFIAHPSIHHILLSLSILSFPL